MDTYCGYSREKLAAQYIWDFHKKLSYRMDNLQHHELIVA